MRLGYKCMGYFLGRCQRGMKPVTGSAPPHPGGWSCAVYLGEHSVDGIATLSDYQVPVKYYVERKCFAEGVRADA